MRIILIFVIFIAVVALQMVFKNSRRPSGLGVQNGKLGAMPKSPNAVSTQCDDPDKKVEPIVFDGDIIKAKEVIKTALADYGNIEVISEESDYLYAVATTKTMKYKDDLEFYFSSNDKLIHFRSASRVGYSDRGLNRERYNALVKLMNKY